MNNVLKNKFDRVCIAHSSQPIKNRVLFRHSFNQRMSNEVVIVDFFNIFSDFREIKYQKLNINFHDIKYQTMHNDLYEFFQMFFDKYVTHVGVDMSSTFIFVMKRLYNFDDALKTIVKLYSCIDIHLAVLPDKYFNVLIDKNKDDFLCQYLYITLKPQYSKIHLVSNDKYRDKHNYIRLFNFDLNVVLFNSHQIKKMEVDIYHQSVTSMLTEKIKTTSIPKRQLANLI